MFFLHALGATGEPGAAGSPGKDGFTSKSVDLCRPTVFSSLNLSKCIQVLLDQRDSRGRRGFQEPKVDAFSSVL